MSTKRRQHVTNRTSENYTESGLETLTGQTPYEWGRYVLKELLDNALDFADESDNIPEIDVELEEETQHMSPGVKRILVRDNGPGIEKEELDRIFEENDSFAGTKRHYCLPTRGNQGNALMTINGIQYLCGKPLRVATKGREYRITTTHNGLKDEHETSVKDVGRSDVEGTLIEVDFGEKAYQYSDFDRVRSTVQRFIALNSHAGFTLTSNDEPPEEYPASRNPTNSLFSLSSRATTGKATWFSYGDFCTRLKADLKVAPDLSIEDFVREFCKLSSKTKWRNVAENIDALGGLNAETIRDLFDNNWELREHTVAALYSSMVAETTPYSAGGLGNTIGSVGKDLKQGVIDYAESNDKNTTWVFYALRDETEKADIETLDDMTVYYADGDVLNSDDPETKTIPFYFELAAIPINVVEKDARSHADVVFGINQSVAYDTPSFGFMNKIVVKNSNGKFKQYREIGSAFETVGHDFTVVCNLTCPNIDFQDKGKQSFNTEPFTDVIGNVVGKAVRKIETAIRPGLNDLRAPEPESEPMFEGRADKGFLKEFVFDHFWKIYNSATNNGQFDLEMRQFFYEMREPLMTEAKRRGYKYSWNASTSNPTPFRLTDNRFRELVTEFEADKIGYRIIERDERGFFVEPHTGKRVRLGTAAVNTYKPDLNQISALLFIEKTGFIGIIEQTEIAKKYDIGVVNAKGFSTLAARDLVEKIQEAAEKADREIPMYVLTDLDIAGLGIAADTKKTDELSPVDELDVERIGITLDDVEQYDLPAEPADYSKRVQTQLNNRYEESEVSMEVYDFLNGGDGGQRVEINALNPVEFAEYLETTFKERGVEKVRPGEDDVDTLESDEDQLDDDINESHKDGIGRGVRDYLEDTQSELVDAIEDHDDIPDAEDLRTKLEDKDLPIGESATETVHKQIVEELEEFPPEGWEDINDDLIDDHKKEYHAIVKEHKEEVADKIQELLNDHATITVEVDFGGV